MYHLDELQWAACRLANGRYRSHTIVGCYPIVYFTEESQPLCADCVTDDDHDVTCLDVNYENINLYCYDCNERIESAYCEDDYEAWLDDMEAAWLGDRGVY